MEVTFYGHACFSLRQEKTNILIDPWLRQNPMVKEFPADLKPNLILVTHGHADHLGDAVEIAKAADCPILSTPEVGYHCAKGGANILAGHLGGTVRFDFGQVTFVPAWHSSSVTIGEERVYAGNPCGFIIKFYGLRFYHAGDTSLFLDMKLIGERHSLDYAFLPIGGLYTMDPEDALEAVKFLQPRTVIPMHYNTWDRVAQNAEEFKAAVERQTASKCLVMKPGETVQM
ncbi:MAG: metal-dependent hydrolase [Deltaproteobacteria bacterium]|nr:metal-dependent hydrolase [Deltaproteobacteria bacterium]